MFENMRSIRLKDITKSREGGRILNKVNLTIPSGEFFALLVPARWSYRSTAKAPGCFMSLFGFDLPVRPVRNPDKSGSVEAGTV